MLEGSRLGGTAPVQVLYGATATQTGNHAMADLTVTLRQNDRVEATIPEEAAGYCYGFYIAPRIVAMFVGDNQNPGTGDSESPDEI